MGQKFSKIKCRRSKSRQHDIEAQQPIVEDRQPNVEDRQPDVEDREVDIRDREVDTSDPETEVEGRKYPNDREASEILFVSLGRIAYDHIEYPNLPVQSEIGGEGLWATFGARLFKPGLQSQEIGCFIVTRNDYPDELFITLDSWDMTSLTRHLWDFPINRARIIYENQGSLRRTLSYLDPPYRPMVRNLRGNILLTAEVFHLSCVPCEVKRQLHFLITLRDVIGEEEPEIVWQPAHVQARPVDPEDPDEASFEETLKSYRDVLPLVNIFSLTYQELEDIAEGVESPAVSEERDVRTSVETLAKLFPVGSEGEGTMIVRCEPFGYYYRNRSEKGWVKAYSQITGKPIVDYTGAGSAFVGAFTVAQKHGNDVRESCIFGAAAASFAMEQFGLPVMTYQPPTPGENNIGGEFWNGERATKRLRDLRLLNRTEEDEDEEP